MIRHSSWTFMVSYNKIREKERNTGKDPGVFNTQRLVKKVIDEKGQSFV